MHPNMKRFIKVAVERQEATRKFYNGEHNFAEMESLDRRFHAWAAKVTDRFGITEVRAAELEAGILESNRAWS